jgi:DNA-binding CsgD family transcriptional regulator
MPPLELLPEDWNQIALDLGLSKREREIMHGILTECTDAQIGAALGISVHTVHTYTERLYRKLRTGNRSGAIIRIFAEYAKLQGHRENGHVHDHEGS